MMANQQYDEVSINSLELGLIPSVATFALVKSPKETTGVDPQITSQSLGGDMNSILLQVKSTKRSVLSAFPKTLMA
jgi:hypothetical protein